MAQLENQNVTLLCRLCGRQSENTTELISDNLELLNKVQKTYSLLVSKIFIFIK